MPAETPRQTTKSSKRSVVQLEYLFLLAYAIHWSTCTVKQPVLVDLSSVQRKVVGNDGVGGPCEVFLCTMFVLGKVWWSGMKGGRPREVHCNCCHF